MLISVRKKLIEWLDWLNDEIEDIGGVRYFIFVIIVTLIAFPFVILYLIITGPLSNGIKTLLEMKEFGLRTAFQKNFHSDHYKKEQREKEEELDKAFAASMPSESRWKKFVDRKDWPDAYVVDGIAIIGAEGRTLIYVDESVEEYDVPEGVKNIYHRCFAQCHQLKRVSLPSTLKRIGKKAFIECVSLKEIVIPESVYIIDEEAFMNCTSLEHINLPSQLNEISIRLFCNCRRLKEINLPKELKVIYTKAFCQCYSLEHIKVNNQLEVIQEKAFENCRSLKEFIMPESVNYCTEGMFNGCHSLEHIHFSSQINDFGGSCCHECWSINCITMPPIKEELMSFYKEKWEKYAEEIDISKSENPYPQSMFWTMGDALFYGVPRLTSVCLVLCFTKEKEYTIPSFVTNIKREAFTSCKNLRTLKLSPYIRNSSEWANEDTVTYGFIYEHWPQIEDIIFDETLKHTKYAFFLMA